MERRVVTRALESFVLLKQNVRMKLCALGMTQNVFNHNARMTFLNATGIPVFV
jgi:hypothetical protein